MALKLVASISGFLFIALAVMFGQAFSPDASNDLVAVGAICAFVSSTAFVLGVVFGRAGLVAAIISGCFALVVVSFPLQLYYATTESLGKYAAVLLLLFALVSAASFLGTCLRRRETS
ncbi:hypothetical protein [Massilia sp. H6]|uniref:hypothetical protein n=1 Tax=Massilia sp. H6 TaxID=2970464 RepID=UPI00216A301E|nr:hypothetical protein [Massilia sp. H6]UVW29587.1 hypothetical protein NRS07_05510 [Massilia sp. H6]